MTEETKQKSSVMLLLCKFDACREKIDQTTKDAIHDSVMRLAWGEKRCKNTTEFYNKQFKELYSESDELMVQMKRYIDIVKMLIKKIKKIPPLESISFCDNFKEISSLSKRICRYANERDIDDEHFLEEDKHDYKYDINYYVIKYTDNDCYDCCTKKTMYLLLDRNKISDQLIDYIKENNFYELACTHYIIYNELIPPSTIIPAEPSAYLIKNAIEYLSEEDLLEFMKFVKQ